MQVCTLTQQKMNSIFTLIKTAAAPESEPSPSNQSGKAPIQSGVSVQPGGIQPSVQGSKPWTASLRSDGCVWEVLVCTTVVVEAGGCSQNVCASADGAGQTEPSPLGLQAASVPANRIKTGSVVMGTNLADWSQDVMLR